MKLHRITHYIKPSFWIFLVIAALLWYVTKLGYRYTTEIPLAVEVTNDFSSRLWIDQPRHTVHCRAEGVGSKLLSHKLRMADRLVIPMSQLTLVPVSGSDELFRIDKTTLTGALAAAGKELRILEILDTALTIRVSPVETRRLAILSRIDIDPAPQHMPVGHPRFHPDSVDARGPRSLLDTLSGIYTRPRQIRDAQGLLSGHIELIPPSGILLSERQTDYRIEVVPYTQCTLDLPVRIDHLGKQTQAIVLPGRVRVTLNVPLRDYERIREEQLHAYVDYLDAVRQPSGRSEVRLHPDSLPAGTEILRIEPQDVETFFTRRP